MSKRLFEKIRSVFSKREKKSDSSVRDRLKIEDVKEELRDMGYYPTHGNRYSTLKFYYADAYYEVRYEDSWLDVRMYLVYDDLSELEICKKASEKVHDQLGFVKSGVGFPEDGSFYVLLKCDAFISSLKEFKKFFPWYFKEVKDTYWWYIKYRNEIRQEISDAQTSLTEN
jgi:hypothetical protein